MSLPLFALLSWGAVVDLDATTWDDLVTNSGKNAFVKFYAPWCGHCKQLKPVWDRLGNEFDSDASVIIGAVDCTDEHNGDLCKRYGVKGYPTLTHIFASTSENYAGGREFEEMHQYALSLRPMCTPQYIDNCDEEQLLFIKGAENMEPEMRKTRVVSIEDDLKEKESDLETLLSSLRQQYDKASAALDNYKKDMGFEINVLQTVNAIDQSKEEL